MTIEVCKRRGAPPSGCVGRAVEPSVPVWTAGLKVDFWSNDTDVRKTFTLLPLPLVVLAKAQTQTVHGCMGPLGQKLLSDKWFV